MVLLCGLHPGITFCGPDLSPRGEIEKPAVSF
jgi:hypothetical protein